MYRGATYSDGTLKSLVGEIRDSLDLASALGSKAIGVETTESEHDVWTYKKVRKWALSTEYPM